jgi:hypothetical protein
VTATCLVPWVWASTLYWVRHCCKSNHLVAKNMCVLFSRPLVSIKFEQLEECCLLVGPRRYVRRWIIGRNTAGMLGHLYDSETVMLYYEYTWKTFWYTFLFYEEIGVTCELVKPLKRHRRNRVQLRKTPPKTRHRVTVKKEAKIYRVRKAGRNVPGEKREENVAAAYPGQTTGRKINRTSCQGRSCEGLMDQRRNIIHDHI